MKGGNFPQTQKNAAKGLFTAPKDNRFLSLQGVVGEQRQKMIHSLAVKAEQAMESNNLTTPPTTDGEIFPKKEESAK